MCWNSINLFSCGTAIYCINLICLPQLFWPRPLTPTNIHTYMPTKICIYKYICKYINKQLSGNRSPRVVKQNAKSNLDKRITYKYIFVFSYIYTSMYVKKGRNVYSFAYRVGE